MSAISARSCRSPAPWSPGATRLAGTPASTSAPGFEYPRSDLAPTVHFIGLGELPANVRVERFIPHPLLLPHVDVMVTNGGYGGVQTALAHGVPLVVPGASEDKPEVANRVQWAGVGVNLRTGAPRPRAIR